MGSPAHVAIVGGGITGLTTAYRIQASAAAAGLPLICTLIEATDRWGGKIVTHRLNGFLIEGGPDSFLSQKPWALDLCRELGLADQVINTNETDEKSFVFSRGRLRPIPEGLVTIVPTRIGPFLRSGLISWPGILRMAMDLVLPGKPPDGDEPLAGFFRRRLGREVFERLIEPLMAGIYAGDADRMSLLATFPRFIELERQYGSLIRGMLKAGRKARTRLDESIRRTTFVTLRDGLSALTARLLTALAEAGTTLRLGRPVTELRVRPTRSKSCRYDLRLSDEVLAADAVVLATPAFASADLVRPFNPGAAQLLDAIPYASTATVSLAYAAADLGPSVKGFGFVVPRSEHRDLLAATWTSLKWKDRAPSFQTLIRGYIGGAGKDSLIKADDETLAGSVRRELKELAAIDSAPSHVTVHRWERGMPQYTMGHLNRLDEIETWLRPYRGLYLAGAAYRGVGIPDCIRDGTDTAERVIRDLRESR